MSGISAAMPDITSCSATALLPLGTITKVGNKTYKYVRNVTSHDFSNGVVCCYFDGTTDGYVTDDSSVTQNNQAVAGVALGVFTASYYGLVQIGGLHTAVKTNGDDDITTGLLLFVSTTDGCCNSAADLAVCSFEPFAVSVGLDNDTNDTVAARLLLCP